MHVFTCACLCVLAICKYTIQHCCWIVYVLQLTWLLLCFFLSSLYRVKLHIYTVSWKTLLEFLLQCLQSRLHVAERHKVARKVLSAKNIENITQIKKHIMQQPEKTLRINIFKKCIEISFMCWMRFVLYVPKPSFKKLLRKIMHSWLV